MSETSEVRIVWAPQAGPQQAMVDCPLKEIFWGGSRGGGKTDGILGKYAVKDHRYGKNFNAIFFRREMPQADDLIERAKEIYIPLGAEWREQPRTFRMPNGGRVRFRPLESVTDAERFQGQNLSDAAVEEAGNYPDPRPIDMLFGALRSKAGVPVQLILTANPGGVGQQWIKYRYIDPAPRGMQTLIRKLSNGGEHRYIYIPSRVQDNRILLSHDPDYINRLHLVGSPELVRAWLDGDWSVVSGAFFPEFSMDNHVVEPRSLPAYWHRFRSFDWGSARPFSVGWWAVSDGELPEFPRGAMVRYREWYGAAKDASGNTVPNTGLRLTAEEVADGIAERERDDVRNGRAMGGVADPSIFAEDGGPSIADRMAARKVFFRPADNARVGRAGAMGGWDQLRARLKGDGERPAIYFFSTCVDTIRTLPAQQHDKHRAEDIDCWVAGTMVATPKGDVPIECVMPGDIVDTPIGPRPVLRSYLSGSSETIRVTMSDGRTIEGTPHHKILVRGIGLIALANLSCYMIPHGRITGSRLLNTVVSCIGGMKDGYTTIRAVAAKAFTGASGAMQGTIFQMGGKSITSTMITTTTTSATSRVWMEANTHRSTSEVVWPVNLDSGSRSGVSRNLDRSSFATMRARCSKIRLSGNARANIVAVLLAPSALQSGFARMLARMPFLTPFARFAARRSDARRIPPAKCGHVHITAVGRCVGKMPVYNLTVADAHLFYANGFVSSNTNGEDHQADEIRYGCLSRPYTAPLPVSPDEERDGYARRWKPNKSKRGSAMAA